LYLSAVSAFSVSFSTFPLALDLGRNEPASTQTSLLSSKITLGVPGTGELLIHMKEKSLLFRDLVLPDLKKEPLYKVWVDKLIRPKAILKKITENAEGNQKKTRKSSSNGQYIDGESSIDDTWTSLIVHPFDKSSADEKGNSLEPSIIFGTISNSDEGLICMKFNSSVTQAVSGYSDSVVRVWRLDEGDNKEDNRNDLSQQSSSSFFGRLLPNSSYHLDEISPKPKEAFNPEYIYNQKLKQSYASSSSSSSFSSSSSNGRSRYPLIELKGHSGPVYSVDINNTDRLVLSSSADETIRLWDTAILQSVVKYSCNSISWNCVFNPILDYYFASANQDSTITVYSTDRILPIRMMTGHISDVNCVSWHGNNTFLASGSDDRTIRLWDIRNAHCNRLLKGSNSPITSISICSLGNLLAAGNELGKIYLYDLRSSRILSVLQGHEGPVNSVAFSSDLSSIVSGSSDCSVRIWDLTSVYETAFTSTAAYQVNAPPNPNTFPLLPASSSSVMNTASSPVATAAVSSPGPVQTTAPPTPTATSSSSEMVGFANYITKVIKPNHSFFTKASPVYHVGYTETNLVYGGGPCSFVSAASKFLFLSLT
jgi:WD40 repeat protein